MTSIQYKAVTVYMPETLHGLRKVLGQEPLAIDTPWTASQIQAIQQQHEPDLPAGGWKLHNHRLAIRPGDSLRNSASFKPWNLEPSTGA